MPGATSRIDRVLRAVSRRTAGQWLGAGLFTALTGLAAPDAASAESARNGATAASAATCKSQQRRCQGTCRKVKTDRRHCGRCNRRCQPGFRCRDGQCRKGKGKGRGSGRARGSTRGGAKRPFPQQRSYGQSRLSRPQAKLNQDVRAYYKVWKARYVVKVNQRQYRIAFGKSGTAAHANTVSEGQGYGMIIVAIMAGHDPQARAIFDGLWRFALAHPSEIDKRLMDWNYRDGSGNASAFDGDADIAYALLLAEKQWGNSGPVNYRRAFNRIIAGIEASTIGPASRLPELGDWVEPNGAKYNQYTTRSSDYMPGHFRAFARATKRKKFWQAVIAASSQVTSYLQANASPTTGLLPDFIEPITIGAKTWRPADPSFLEDPQDGTYDSNACRVPWRLGTDALLNKSAVSAAQVRRISRWAQETTGGVPARFRAGYHLDGTPLPNSDYVSAFFIAPLGVAAMATPGQKAWLNAIYALVRNRYDDYYADSINLICMLVMTRNFWQP